MQIRFMAYLSGRQCSADAGPMKYFEELETECRRNEASERATYAFWRSSGKLSSGFGWTCLAASRPSGSHPFDN